MSFAMDLDGDEEMPALETVPGPEGGIRRLLASVVRRFKHGDVVGVSPTNILHMSMW